MLREIVVDEGFGRLFPAILCDICEDGEKHPSCLYKVLLENVTQT